jgi:hypothetical protein
VIRQSVISTPCGPSGAPEILALIYADDPSYGYFYGHIITHPNKPSTIATAIVWSNKLVNATHVQLQFARFHYWIKDRLEYEPCSSQRDGDVYAESDNFIGAAHNLISMIDEFELERRYAYEGSPYHESLVDMRVIDLYGMTGKFDKNGAYDPPPMPVALYAVR